MMKDERTKQKVVGTAILLGLALLVPGVLLGWRFLPGLLGEWVGFMIGVMATPFFLEASFAILGLVIVICLNHWRQHKDGDEFVYLEQVTGPDVPKDLPDHAKWAVYRDKPSDPCEPITLAQAEGAVAIGDHEAAAAWLETLSPEELRQPAVLRLRLELANATGRKELAESLTEELRLRETAEK